MSAHRRIAVEARTSTAAFLRRRTAVVFTFVFPLLLVVIFGALVETGTGTGGLFLEEPAYYVAGYVGTVVLFTPLSRVGSEVARHRDGNRFEKLATTPLRRPEWLAGQTLVNVGVVGLAAVIVLVATILLTGADVVIGPASLLAVAALVAAAVAVFCAVGAILGTITSSQDGVIAASNTVALPLLFLSETFVPPSMLPGWLPTGLSPLTHFARGTRAALAGNPGEAVASLGVLTVAAVGLFALAAYGLPTTD